MSTRILKSFIFISLLIILSSCSSSSEESDTYFDNTYQEIENHTFLANESTKQYEKLIKDLKPEKAMKLLNDQVIPDYEILLAEIEAVKLNEDELIEFNSLFHDLIKIDLEKLIYKKLTFEEIIIFYEEDKLEDFNPDTALEKMALLNEQSLNKSDKLVILADELTEDNELSYLNEVNQKDIDSLNKKDAQLIAQFIESMTKLPKLSGQDKPVEIDERLLADQGNQEVVFTGDVTVKNERFVLTGKSNLLGGAILNVKSYQYGEETAYFKGDFQVDDHGDFELEMDVDKDKLNNEPYIVQISYLPETSDDAEAHSIYGKLGENLTGEFKQKYTDVKKTRHGAFVYAYTELTPDTKVPLINQNGDAPDDYGNLNIWMEKDKVDTQDLYYDITMNSNLIELTDIKASVKVLDHDVSGLKSSTIVNSDGSFRFRIPRPNSKEIDNKDVIILIEATVNGAFETEELYGEHGKKFKGELSKDSNRGKKIEYKLHLGKDS